MNSYEQRRLLKKWEKERSRLQSKIDSLIADQKGKEVVIEKFTINWETAGLNLYGSPSKSESLYEQRHELDEATRKCQPEISELAKLVDRDIKRYQRLNSDRFVHETARRWPKCLIEANRALAGMRN